ncbi:hypothetical protein [Roseateles depolymerans]|uniref:hypothetical protein n=1 Tax=Roseateles depolymerans TaxID=76731 RepID=UPI000E255DCF|nr:hypothetical protein [Roseateles depolymerans]
MIPVTDPQTGKSDYAFPLQTSAWLKMQAVVKTAIAFPLTSDDFTNLYGDFSDEAAVTQAVGILGQIQKTASQYGDPQTLISQLSAFQQSNTPPESIYGHAVWLAAQTITNAQQIVSLLTEGLNDIGTETDPKQRIADLTALLTGDGGISTYADSLNRAIGVFQTKTSTFYTTLNGQLTGPTNSLQVYLKQENNVYSDAQGDVTTDQGQIDSLNSTINDLNKEYIGFTVAASVSPALILIPFFGPLIAVADAVTFGVLAAKVKKQIDDLKNQLAGVEADEQKKTALVTQLGGFNLAVGDVEADGQDFLDAIATMASGWGEFQSQINLRLSSLTVEDVQDWSAFMDKINFKAAVDGWTLIASKAETFYQSGFVKFTNPSSSY